MDFEKDLQHLQTEVNACFYLDPVEEAMIYDELEGVSVLGLETMLGMIRANQMSGLKTDVAKALVAGEPEELEIAKKHAHEQAVAGCKRKVARELLQRSGVSPKPNDHSRIRQNNRNNWNTLGYIL